jgi:hypothetical protein
MRRPERKSSPDVCTAAWLARFVAEFRTPETATPAKRTPAKSKRKTVRTKSK